MEIDLADQLKRIVEVFDSHPIAALLAALFILLAMALRKEGVASKFLDLLTERSRLDALKEERRMKMLDMVEQRPQASLPGLEESGDHDRT